MLTTSSLSSDVNLLLGNTNLLLPQIEKIIKKVGVW